MPLAAGARLGPFEILSALGAGAMGEVYRARDGRLGREVAIKVLPPSLAADGERLRRFEQEARAAGALNHPNVLALYDIGSHQGLPYLVTELLAGETLAERLARGPLAPRKAVDVAVQIARGLGAAHERGIVHRDLKPANVFVCGDGQVKILDFGLARLAQAAPAGGPGAAEAPTLTRATDAGAVLGTPGYMAPEQVRGLPAEPRSDLFALGAILYEMLAGRPAFPGETAAERMTAALRDEPPELPASGRPLPAGLDRIVRHCLEKDPGERFQSARDLGFALASLDVASGSGAGAAPAATPAAADRRRLRRGLRGLRGLRLAAAGAGALAALAVLAALGGMAFGLGRWARRAPPPAEASFRYLTFSGRDASPAASPDGRLVAFSSDRDGRPRIWLEQLAGGGEVALTSGPDDLPRFSPDGAQILFSRDTGGGPALYRVPVLGGEARKVLDDADDADFSPDGRQIAFIRLSHTSHQSVASVLVASAEGGEVREIARGFGLNHPRWAPDGRTLALTRTVYAGTEEAVLLVSADGKRQWTILAPKPFGGNLSAVAWSGPGELAYIQSDSVIYGGSGHLIRQDARTGKVRAASWVPESSNVLDLVGPGRVVFDAGSSRQNLREITLAPAGGGASEASAATRWLSRGNATDRQPVYSPDGDWVAFSSNRSGNLDLWEVSTRTGALRRLTDDAADDWDPAFTRDGRRLLWSSNRDGHFECWTAGADGSGARPLTHGGTDAENPATSPDGSWLVYISGNAAGLGLWRARADGSGARRLAPQCDGPAEISPDGQYVLYPLNLTLFQSVLRVLRLADGAPVPFELSIDKRRRSVLPNRARWMPDGRAIAFLGQNDQGVNGVFVQDFAPGRDTRGSRRSLGGFDPDLVTESFAISPDGKRLVVAGWEQLYSIMAAEGLPGIDRPRPRPGGS